MFPVLSHCPYNLVTKRTLLVWLSAEEVEKGGQSFFKFTPMYEMTTLMISEPLTVINMRCVHMYEMVREKLTYMSKN